MPIARAPEGLFKDYLVLPPAGSWPAQPKKQIDSGRCRPALQAANPLRLDQNGRTGGKAPEAAFGGEAGVGSVSQDEALIKATSCGAFQGAPDFYAPIPGSCAAASSSSAHGPALKTGFCRQGGRAPSASRRQPQPQRPGGGGRRCILGELYGEAFFRPWYWPPARTPRVSGAAACRTAWGLGSEDFRPNSGIVAVRAARIALIERADRLEETGELPFIVNRCLPEQVVEHPDPCIPLWLAFRRQTAKRNWPSRRTSF